MEILERDAHIDNLVMMMSVGGGMRTGGQVERDIYSAVSMRKTTFKPMMAILPYQFLPENVHQVREAAQKLQDGGIPAFTTIERGAIALRNALEYYTSRNSITA